LAKAVASGYEVVESINLPHLALDLTRLSVPAAERFQTFEPPNRAYAISAPLHSSLGAEKVVETPFTCSADQCYGPSMIGWNSELAACARGVRVGLIGTGFDEQHPAFAGKMPNVRGFRSDPRPPAASWHGTAILALLGAAPGNSVSGLITDAEFLVADVSFADQHGRPVTDTLNLLKALNWMADARARIVILNIFGPGDELLQLAIGRLTRTGMLFVAPAGDAGPAAPPSYPAAYEEVIAVTAVDRGSHLHPYAARGNHIDLAAPGVGSYRGTSFAVPYVTAALAAIHTSAAQAPLGVSWKGQFLSRLKTRDGDNWPLGRGILVAPNSFAPEVVDPYLPREKGPWVSTVRPVGRN
jgi:subtilisin family serine protease